MVWLLPSALAVALAVLGHLYLRRRDGEGGNVADGGGGRGSGPTLGAYYAIGDLHGDVRCARHWVNRTGLIENFRPESEVDDPEGWWWNVNVGSSLVFVGDYVDKGPTSRQTVEFVRVLTERFPDRVTAILGNHELELLRDRDPSVSGGRWGGGPYGGGFHQLPYASAHPAEYLNYLENPSPDETDSLVVELLYTASAEVYGLGHYQYARMAPPPPGSGNNHDASSYYRTYGMVPITEYIEPKHRDLVAERLASYQRAYLDAYRSDAELGRWVEARPVVHLAPDGTLFVHGGLSGDVAAHLLALSSSSGAEASATDLRVGVDRLNGLFRRNSHESSLTSFLDDTRTGRAVEELLTYRENHPHPHYGGERACSDLESILNMMGGTVRRVAVGHTPDATVRISCGGKLLAVDSLLGRWIRASGNDYCPAADVGADGARGPPMSSDGRYVCPTVGKRCEGQIVRFDVDGDVEIIH